MSDGGQYSEHRLVALPEASVALGASYRRYPGDSAEILLDTNGQTSYDTPAWNVVTGGGRPTRVYRALASVQQPEQPDSEKSGEDSRDVRLRVGARRGNLRQPGLWPRLS